MDEGVRTRYRVTGMDCGACAAKVDAAVRRLDGVSEVSVSVSAGVMTVAHRSDPALFARIEAQVAGLGYGVGPAAEPAIASPHGRDNCCGLGHDAHGAAPLQATPKGGLARLGPKGRLTAACGAGLLAAYLAGLFAPELGRWTFLAAMLTGLVPIARRAFAASRAGSPFSIETLMSVAAVGAVAIGATEEAAVVVFLFLIGELLEGLAAERARASIRGLAALTPKTALRERGGRVEEIAAEKLAIGEVILVRPFDRVPADGEIVEGESGLNEAPITGESVPRRKGPGAAVFAGSINGDAALRVRVMAAAADNTIARVVRLVEEAQEKKAPTERFIDRFARSYAPAVVGLAALVAVLPPLAFGASWEEWIYKGLALLLIGCPCALVISTPAAISAALSAAARRGLLIKGGATLEAVGGTTVAAFDKTGTLTAGAPQVADIVGFDRSPGQALAIAAALERGSSHPLALAIVRRAEADGVPALRVVEAKAIAGAGVCGEVEGSTAFLGSVRAVGERAALSSEQIARAATLTEEGKTVCALVVDGAAAGLIALRDEPREDAAAGLTALKAEGVATMMLTGDNRRTAEAIGARLGVEARAELLPQDKLNIVRELQARGEIVALIGDGVNDAPALAAADVGIAMGGGTDVALETGDAALLRARVGDVARMVRLSRKTMRNIRQNVTIALGLKALFLVTTVAGLTGLWPAILADTGATALVTLNALRLLRVKLD